MRIACLALLGAMSTLSGGDARADGFPTVEQLAGRLSGTSAPQGAAQIAGRLWFRAYRSTISRARGPACNFEPSCSHYAEQAVEEYGLLRGLVMTGDRLERCNPCLNPSHYPRGRAATEAEPRLHDPPGDNDVWWFF